MTDRVSRELVLPAPVEEVWEIVTTSGWLAEEVQLELVAGGDARFLSPEEEKSGWVEDVVPPSGSDQGGRLIFWWSAGDEPATRVTLTMEPLDSGLTHLHIVETRPLEVLDLVGTPLPGAGGQTFGPALVAA